jgi:hypothetical protein
VISRRYPSRFTSFSHTSCECLLCATCVLEYLVYFKAVCVWAVIATTVLSLVFPFISVFVFLIKLHHPDLLETSNKPDDSWLSLPGTDNNRAIGVDTR